MDSDSEVGTARPRGMLTVAGRYRLLALIGSGGMGRVWRARDEVLDRLVAVKELLPPAASPVADRRIAQLPTMREARAAARLEHPSVVRIYDVLQVTGRTWIVMEYVESESLQQRVTRDGPLPHQDAARIGVAVLQALRAAHAAGVVHHDVKPANVLLAADGRIMLTDFGLATLDTAAAVGDGTQTAPLLGSPHYVAPERLRGSDPSSVAGDLWSLGATLYTAVEGRPPFDRSSIAESLAAALVEEPDPPQHLGPLHPIIAALMVRDPAARVTAGQAHESLQTITHRAMGVSAVPAPRRPPDDVRFRPAVVAARVPVAPPRPASATAAQEQARPRSSRRRSVVGLGVAAVLLAAGSAVVALNRDEGRQTTVRSVADPAASATTAISACDPADRQPLTTPSAEPAAGAVPPGWRAYRDPAGFAVATPEGWTRSQMKSLVCLRAPDDSVTFTVSSPSATAEDPLQHWQNAEQAALTRGTLPGYRKVAMGVLLVTGGGADWEYSWQPPSGPRLHTRRILLPAGGARPFELSWTTQDRDWTSQLRRQRALLATFRDPLVTASTWAVPAP
ncbi:serine/threonine-protein kinase [Symbioplanes lichenis]|uniref:serine/threonine-protein kinase n=1 Tax=Symbioplanes lichenis TaxID=1629072 RepID=UPI0027396F9A|nr:serine/threonine-protein kinase [Actinoplanes lichenis]